MSLILEALRKSEAERRRGQLPDLHAERPPLAQPAHEGPPAWLWLALAMGFVAVIAIAWMTRGGWLPSPGTADAALQPTSASVPAKPMPDPLRRPVPDALRVATVAGAGEPGVPASTVDDPATPAATSPAPRKTAIAQPKLSPPIDPPVATPKREARIARSTAGTSPAATEPLPAATRTREPAAPSATATPAVADITPATTTPNTTRLQLANLAAAERRELPPLRISMHMWNSAPEQRFVIIDGNRVTEGSRVGDAVVEAITRDGVVLAWRSRLIELPIR